MSFPQSDPCSGNLKSSKSRLCRLDPSNRSAFKCSVDNSIGPRCFLSLGLTVKLLHSLKVTEFECKRDAAVCRCWRAVNLIEALEMSQLNCDTDPADLCVRARQLLGDDNLSHQEIKEGLFVLGQGVPVQGYPWLNAIRDSVVDYVCEKDPQQCKGLR